MYGSRLLSRRWGLGPLALSLVSGSILLQAAPPAWWSDGDPPVIDPQASPNNHGVANIGQAKHMAKQALEALRAVDAAAADEVESGLIGGGKPLASWHAPVSQAEKEAQHAPLLIGQLKAIAAPFYTVLHQRSPVWLEGELTANQTKDAQDAQNHFPWTSATTDDQNQSPATIGQLKAVFSLRFEAYSPQTVDDDGDGLPDDWETAHFDDPSIQTDIGDPDDDGMDNAYEFAHGTDPNDFFNGETPVLRVTGGDGEIAALDTLLSKPLRVTVKRPNGEPYLNAAVTFQTANGYAGLAGGVASSLVRTTADGSASIAYRAPATAGTTLVTATLTTGQSVTLRVYAVNPASQVDATTGQRKPPIRNFVKTANADGTVTFTWISDADNGDWFEIGGEREDGTWKPVYKTTYGSAVLPYVPGTTTYSLTLNPAADYLP